MKGQVSTVVAALLVVLTMQAGVSAATTDTSGPSASAGGTLNGKVRIHLVGRLTSGPGCLRVARGRFTLSGAMSDRGWFESRWGSGFQGCGSRLGRSVRTSALHGRKGSISITWDWDHWRVTRGTARYSGLIGRGRQKIVLGDLLVASGFEARMTGTVRQ